MTKFHICIKVCALYCISLLSPPGDRVLSGHIMGDRMSPSPHFCHKVIFQLIYCGYYWEESQKLVRLCWQMDDKDILCPAAQNSDAKCCCSRPLQSLIIEWIVCTFANFISKQPSQAEKSNCHWIAAAGGRGRGAWPLAGSLKFWARSQWHCGPGREMHNFINYLQKMRTARLQIIMIIITVNSQINIDLILALEAKWAHHRSERGHHSSVSSSLLIDSIQIRYR